MRAEGADTTPLLRRLDDLHSATEAVLDTAIQTEPRFANYKARFTRALTRLHEGDASAFARPMSDSYHDVWMELHEDFISSLGHERTEADE